jgi:hypothetical protein
MFALTFLLGALVAVAASANPAPASVVQKTFRDSIGTEDSVRRGSSTRGALMQTAKVAREGVWGGASVMMEITDAGAAITYDCAHGTIEQRIELDGEGRFEVRGTHTRERGGPTRSGETPDRHPARYTGRVDGKIMTLVVTLTDAEETIGTFSLTFGERPELHRCA